MDMTERSGQPSMEEILASIRRIIAEEPADAISLDFKPRSNGAGQNADLDDSSDFELPSMFRASTGMANGSLEKTPTTSGKLMDALRATPQLDTSASARAEPVFPLPASFAEIGTQPFETRQEPSSAFSPLTRLSALRPTARAEPPPSEMFGGSTQAFAMPSVESVSTEPATRASWAIEPAETPAPVVAAPSAPVARQMVPFRDQHFTRMSMGPAPAAPAPEVAVAAELAAQAALAPSFATLAFNSATPPPLTQVAPHGADVAPQPYTPTSLTGAIRAAEAAAASSTGVAGPIEDATAELLRPMLRQWLSENMPRMVEKALHIEVAESVKPGKKPGSL